MEEIKLERVMLEITKKCNLKCNHCYASAGTCNKNEISKEEIFKLLDYMKKNNIKHITFTGGEPFCRNDFIEILEYTKKLEIKFRIFTNGVLLNDKLIEKLKKLNISYIQISLDGANENIHDDIRGIKGSYKKTIKNIKKLINKGINVIPMTTIQEKNIHEILDLSKMIKQMGLNSWSLNVFIPIGRAKKLNEINLNIFKETMKFFGGAGNAICSNTACGVGFNKIAVLSNGDIVLCEVIQDIKLGNIRKDDLLEVFYNNKTINKLRDSIAENIPKCNSCLFKQNCRAGCKASVFYRKGTFYEPDPINCIGHKLTI